MIVHARIQTALPALLQRMGANGDDRHWRAHHGDFVGTDSSRRLKAIQIGHLAVHQYQIVATRSRVLDRLRTVFNAINGQPRSAQQRLCDQGVQAIILHQQYMSAQGDRRRWCERLQRHRFRQIHG